MEKEEMDVKIQTDEDEYKVTGRKCKIVEKTFATRFIGSEIKETIYCKKFKVKKVK